MHKSLLVTAGVIGLAFLMTTAVWSADQHDSAVDLGRSATDEEIRAWDIDVAPDGQGLPPGHGTVAQGAQIYAMRCAGCHGPTGREGPQNVLVGGHKSLQTVKPLKTIGSYWPYATTVYDYLRRAMPANAPQSLMPDELYALVAWLLYQNGIIAENVELDHDSLPRVEMPNRNGFRLDPRPDVR